MNILLDLDGVLSDFFTEALFRLNENFDGNITAAEYIKHNTFDMARVFGITSVEFWETLEQDCDFWNSLKPFPWAQLLLDILSDKGEVTICSSPSYHPICAAQKIQWCLDHLKINSSAVMLGGRKYLMARPDAILIDDFPKNVKAFRAAGSRAILVPSNWNTHNLTLQKVIASLIDL